jgi:hypothetical protein
MTVTTRAALSIVLPSTVAWLTGIDDTKAGWLEPK